MFGHHKKFPWFNEKYNPGAEFINLRNRVRKEGWKGRPEQFLKDLEEGKYDPHTKEQTDAAKTAEESEGEKQAGEEAAVATGGDDAEAADEDVNMESKDNNGKQQQQNGKQRKEDDVLVAPEGNQIAIRTIPPDIGRQKIELVGCCFLHI